MVNVVKYYLVRMVGKIGRTCSRLEAMKNGLKTGLSIAVLGSIVYMFAPKAAFAQDFTGYVRGGYGFYSTVNLINPPGDDTVSTVSTGEWWIGAPASWNLQQDDTVSFFVTDVSNQRRQDIWHSVVYGETNSVLTMFLDDSMNYTVGSVIINSWDSTIIGTYSLTHNGSTVQRTEFVQWYGPPWMDKPITFNLATLDSVLTWAGGDWSNLYGDSVSIFAYGIAYGDTGSASGVIDGFYGDGQILPDIDMNPTSIEENQNLAEKVTRHNLQVKQNPSENPVFICPAYAGRRKEIRIYAADGSFVRKHQSDNGIWVIDGLDPGAYFAIVDEKRQKVIVAK